MNGEKIPNIEVSLQNYNMHWPERGELGGDSTVDDEPARTAE